MLDAAQSGPFKIAIARDPSGNAIELLARPGKWAVGGAKLIVSDRQKAEEFYAKIFNATPGQRYKTPAYDEVADLQLEWPRRDAISRRPRRAQRLHDRHQIVEHFEWIPSLRNSDCHTALHG
jgi:hypothetical protein